MRCFTVAQIKKTRRQYWELLLGASLSAFPLQVLCADCPVVNRCAENNWKFILGGQLTHRSPEMHYEEKDGVPPREIDIHGDYTERKYVPFPMFRAEYAINQKSSLGLAYDTDDTDTSALERKTVKFLFFPIRFGLRVPLKINTQSLKVRYNRAFYQSDNLEFGGSLGLQVMKIDVQAQIPITGEENENLIAPLPLLGAYAKYFQTDKISYKLRADYLPLKVGSTSGELAEFDVAAEYQYNQHWLMGLGFRYAHLKLDLDHDNYRADVSHITYGPTLYVGTTF